MRLAPVIDRLKAKRLKRVYGALELAGLDKEPGATQLPAYFVIPDGWSASPNRTTGVHDQLVSEDFGVVILMAGAPLREGQTSDALHEAELAVIAALAGWTHPDATRACEASRARMVSVSRNTLGWFVGFSTGRRIRLTPDQ